MRDLLLWLYRIRIILLGIAVVVLVGIAIFGDAVANLAVPLTSVSMVAVGLLLVGVVLSLLGPRYLSKPVTKVVASPVRGRWLALNSPASKVPSHGIRAYGQTYAIDLVSEPTDQSRPVFGTGVAMRAATHYPAFGEPVYAMVSGTVVRATDWRRDHRARSNVVGACYLMLEGAIRELGGPGFILGNHVIIRTNDGLYALVAHVQHGSVTVEQGESVRAGQQLARCGNSGNSSEPHVHAQLMDRKSSLRAIGIPLVFESVMLDEGTASNGLPKTGQYMLAR